QLTNTGPKQDPVAVASKPVVPQPPPRPQPPVQPRPRPVAPQPQPQPPASPKEVKPSGPPYQPPPVVPVAIKPPKLDQDKVSKPLPGTVSGLAVGGGGRYLILYMPQQRRLAVFDVNEAQVVKYVPLAEDNIKFTASMDRLVVAYPKARVIERWNLT